MSEIIMARQSSIYDYDAATVENYYLEKTLLYDDAFKKELYQLAPEVIDHILRLGYYRAIELHWSNYKVYSSLRQDILYAKQSKSR